MARQHATPLLIGPDGRVVSLRQLGTGVDESRRVSEATIQTLVATNPECLPIRDIDPVFAGAISVCTELNTPAGPIDIFMVTASGLPILVECKLWRNPESRREVVGQIIDYAKELSRWTCSDVQREVNRRLGTTDNELFRLVRERDDSVDEVEFNDALSLNLRRGRFLLLLVGDGIREGVEAIAEYVQRHAGLHFTLGLVELPLFECTDGSLLVTPRVVARTELLTRTVVAVPDGLAVVGDTSTNVAADEEELDPTTAERIEFWTDFLSGLQLDDPDQPKPNPPKQGYAIFGLPAPSGSCWLIAYRNVAKNQVGVFLSYMRGSVGERAVLRILEGIDEIRTEIDVAVETTVGKDGRQLLTARAHFANLKIPDQRDAAIDWLRQRTNEFVNAFRPRIRAAVADLSEGMN